MPENTLVLSEVRNNIVKGKVVDCKEQRRRKGGKNLVENLTISAWSTKSIPTPE